MAIPVRRDGEARDALIVITHTHMTIPVRRARKVRGALIAITHIQMTIPQKIPLRGPLHEHDSPHLSRRQHLCPRNTFHPFTPPAPSVIPNKIRP